MQIAIDGQTLHLHYAFILFTSWEENINIFSFLELRLLRSSFNISAASSISAKVEVKLKLSLCLTKHHAMKTYWGEEV
jgi:hypothetical protein